MAREHSDIGRLLAAELPFLRRYARALTGSQVQGDALVREFLAALLGQPVDQRRLTNRVAVFAAFTRLCNAAPPGAPVRSPEPREASAQAHLRQVTPLARQALLLTAIEEFTVAEAATILARSEPMVSLLIEEGLAEIRHSSRTHVLLIEDEPLIAMVLEDLITMSGHTLIGTASTRAQAQALLRTQVPGLVLADIQLAHGSSGLDAVADVLAIADVPVIVVTAYPERLLIGEGIEPAFLVTKPFSHEAVLTAMAQALFFHGE